MNASFNRLPAKSVSRQDDADSVRVFLPHEDTISLCISVVLNYDLFGVTGVGAEKKNSYWRGSGVV